MAELITKMKKPNAHIASVKKELVKTLVKCFEKYPIIGVANFESLPAAQLQVMRKKFRGTADIFMAKKRLIMLAIKQSEKSRLGLEKLIENLTGMPALIFSKENPFKLSRLIKKNKTPSPAKTGQKAPRDIIVNAGPTPFAPGPVISELSQLGVKAGVEGGKIVIKQDAVVAKEGEIISPLLSSILLRLGVTPMEIGIDLVSVYERGIIYNKKVLDVDEKAFMQQLNTVIRYTEALAVEITYPTKRNIERIVQKAFNNSKALAVSQGILAKGVVEDVLSKAHRQMLAIKQLTEGG